MKSRASLSPPSVRRDKYGIPIVQPASRFPKMLSIQSLTQPRHHDEKDENQLYRMSATRTTQQPQSQRNHSDYYGHYKPLSNASSPRMDSWHDALSEPFRVDTLPSMVYSPPRQPNKLASLPPFTPNPIEAPANRNYEPLSGNKRKNQEKQQSSRPNKFLKMDSPPLPTPTLPSPTFEVQSSIKRKQQDTAESNRPNNFLRLQTAKSPLLLPPRPTNQTMVDRLFAEEAETSPPPPPPPATKPSPPPPASKPSSPPTASKPSSPPPASKPSSPPPASKPPSPPATQPSTLPTTKPIPPAAEPATEVKSDKRPTEEEIKAQIKEEIESLMKTVKSLSNYYKLEDKIGRGTFSTVYKALDLRREKYDNSTWEPQLLSSSPGSPSEDSKSLHDYVALKRIYHTSSPSRIANEISILKKFRGCACISPLITAFRQNDQVFVVMPYIQHDDFKKTFNNMSMTEMRYYLKSLFTALDHLHSEKIIHRDVKPNNFLYNRKKKTGYLIDFGLAEHENESKKVEDYIAEVELRSQKSSLIQSSRAAATSGMVAPSVLTALTNKEQNVNHAPTVKPEIPVPTVSNTGRRVNGYVKNDARYHLKANRAGTKGFRAPETLMRVARQTGAIDVWAAGVILLSFLTGRYPFFLAADEADAVVELASLFGTREMSECAANYNRVFSTNVSLPRNRMSMEKLCEALNKARTDEWEKKELEEAISLLNRCTDLNFTTRITAKEALEHPFLQMDEQ